MDRKYNIQLNLSPYANYFLDGGNTGGMTYTPEDNGFIRGSFSTDWTPQGISPNDAVLSDYQQKMVNRADMKQAIAEKGKGFSDKMNSSGGGGWANAIAPAATNIANAFLDTEASTADRVAGALGIPALANQWRADTSKGDSYLKGMTSTLDSMSGKNYIQDASSTFGANNTVKLNNKQIISPISPASALPSLKDFKGNWWRNMGASVAQGAASGSVGGPWGAAGGALTGLFGSLGGLFGRKKRAEKAYEDFLHKRDTLMSAQQNAFNTAVKNQTLSNMQALANGNMSQRINDMANIRAYGGNLFDGGGDLTDEQQMVLADIQADPRILFTPKYSQWRDYIRRTSPDYLDRLYTSLPYEQQQDIYQNDREAWGALSNKTKGDFGGAQVRKKTDEVSPYVAGALGLVGAAPAMEAVAMFPMLENGLNAYFGYEGVKNLPTAVADTYNYAKEGDWSRAGLSAGEAALDGMFIGNGIKGIKGISNVVKPKNVMNMPSNGNYIPSRNYFYSQIDNPSVAKYIAEVEGNPAFQTRPFSKFNSEDETLSYLRHNSLGRTRKYGTDSFYPEQIDEFDKAFNNYMKDYDYQTFNSKKWEKAGKEDLAGFHDPENKYIAAVEDSKTPLKDIMRHEVRHAYDNYEDILSNKQHDILDNAYGSDFVDLPKKVAGNDPLKNYSNMGLEKTTTNLDARKALLKGREESASIEVQNMIIDKMTDEKIIEAVRNSNGYGRRYIEYLEENNLLTPQKVQAFRDAMKYVGIGIGVGLISNNNNIEYAMGGNLYTDLSPNMMNLWNNKQQIDQQKAMNQQFSLGLGNSSFVNKFETGGQMTSLDVPDNMQYFANGGTHEENPYGGIQVGTDQQGTPNLVEEGEFRWNNFVFSDRINVDANLLSSFNLAPATKHQNKKAAKGKLSYADMAKKYAKRNKELENDPITKNSMEAFMQRLANAQEYQKKAEQLEAQKQNELQDYKTALNKQNNNPMYGTMKYNGMGNDATQQGVNSGVDAGIGNPMSNADLSNVNRSGNEMMAAYGGNLFAIGGKDDPNPYEWTLDNLNARQVLTPWNGNFIGPTLGDNTNLGITPSAGNYSWGNINANTPFYQNEGWGIDMKPTYMKVKNPNYNAPAVSTYASRDKNGKIVYDPSGKPFMSYPRTYEGMKSSDYPNTKVIGKTVDNNGFYLNVPQYTPPAQGKVIQPEYEPDLSDYKAAYYKDFDSNDINITPYVQDNIVRGNNGISNIPITASGINPTGVPSDSNNSIGDTNTAITNSNKTNTDSRIGKTTTNTNPDAAVPSDPKEAPLYSTAGKYAQFGKGIMPMIWDWANKTNVKYDPYQRDADRLEALANEGPALRTADTIGGYRAPNLMDVERLNNSARAEGLAQMQAILDAANGNRGFVGAQSAQNNYNTQKGIGDNYIKAQEANNAERLQTDQFNHGINVANQNAINAMYQDNQRAEQAQHQAALSGTAQATALRQRENFHADEVNTERMKNRATNQAAAVDNALNYFTTQAMENQELNTRNNDPTNPYWIDKYGRTHYTGDSGLTQAIRDEFGNDEYGRNGTFTGERLTEWNNLTKKYKAKDLKEHPELWRHLVAQQREANKIDADKAKQAKLEELEALRGTYQSNLARLNALRDSGAIISDPSYNLYTGWADEDYSGNQGLLRNRNQALDQYITQIGNNYDRYLYEKQLAQNQAKALGGYLDNGQNNNNYYYSYTRI